MTYWLRCWPVYRSITITFSTQAERDDRVVTLVTQGFPCTFGAHE